MVDMRTKREDLLNGNILKTILFLSAPMMAQGVLNTAYNLADMVWLGRLSADAVTAAGMAGMFTWFAFGVVVINRTGTQVRVGQSLGAGDRKRALSYAAAGFQLILLEGLFLSIVGTLGADAYINAFGLESKTMIKDSIDYMVVCSIFLLVSFFNNMFSGIHNARGDSRTPFVINSAGLFTNIVLDPILIFKFGMGVKGAAIATIVAQTVSLVMNFYIASKDEFIISIPILKKQDSYYYKDITKIGLPTGLENIAFSVITMVMSRFITSFGDAAISAQKIGTQIESITYVAAEGFSSAGNAFIAQNYGAKKKDRIANGKKTIEGIGIAWGTFCTLVLVLFPRQIISIFIREKDVIEIGASYLRILGFSQLFNVNEYTSAGVFNGLGITLPPSLVGVSLTSLRIPLAYILQQSMGLDGIWWTCSISASLKGIVLTLWLNYTLKHKILVECA